MFSGEPKELYALADRIALDCVIDSMTYWRNGPAGALVVYSRRNGLPLRRTMRSLASRFSIRNRG
jgi:hypothetical protein